MAERPTFNEAKLKFIEARKILLEMFQVAADFNDISPKERDIIQSRIVKYDTLKTISKKYGISRVRVLQLERRIEQKMGDLTKV